MAQTSRHSGSLVPDGASDLVVGNLLAQAYRGAWRSSPPPLDLTPEELGIIMSHLIDVNGVGLVWPRLRHRAEEYGAIGMPLEYGYRQQVEWNAGAEARIATAVGVLRASRIDPILIKGWTISRRYPSPAVRLAGDVDLVVRPDEFSQAKSALAAHSMASADALPVDLHHDNRWVDVPPAGFRSRTTVVEVAGVPVQVLSEEDQFFVACSHAISHAILRPLWLCDIGLLLEGRSTTFDWDSLFTAGCVQRNWVIMAVLLAHHLLGADLADTPLDVREHQLPGWVVPAVLCRWVRATRQPLAVAADLRRWGLVQTIQHRWLEPIGAIAYLGIEFDEGSQFPIQLRAFLTRLTRYGIKRMPSQLWSRS